MNQVILVGRVVRDIELKQINEQHQVVNNVLAINRKQRDKNGELLTDFIPIIAWDSLAQILEKHCQKGQRIAVCGKLQSRQYTSNQQTKFVIECVLNEVTLLERPNNNRQTHIPQFTAESD